MVATALQLRASGVAVAGAAHYTRMVVAVTPSQTRWCRWARWLAALAMVACVACGGGQQRDEPLPPIALEPYVASADSEQVELEAAGVVDRSRSSMFGTVWKASIERADNPTEYVLLRSDGQFEYNYSQPSGFIHDGTDSWTFDGQVLILKWTDGYSIERYDLSEPGTVYSGRKSSRSWGDEERSCTIEQVR